MCNFLDDLFGDVNQQLEELEKSAYKPKEKFFKPQDMNDEEIDALVEECLQEVYDD